LIDGLMNVLYTKISSAFQPIHETSLTVWYVTTDYQPIWLISFAAAWWPVGCSSTGIWYGVEQWGYDLYLCHRWFSKCVLLGFQSGEQCM
jgi:hypothetical protein